MKRRPLGDLVLNGIKREGLVYARLHKVIWMRNAPEMLEAIVCTALEKTLAPLEKPKRRKK